MNGKQVLIFDTTLRDGEQAPGASMTVRQKLDLALQLERLGVDVIEAGFAVSSPAQFEAVELVARELTGPAVASLCRAVKGDLDAGLKALKRAKRPRIHTFVSTSPIHMEHKLKKKPADVLKMAVESVRYARGHVADVEWSAEDASRTELPFLLEIVQAVIEAGATTINLPDTVGYAVPEEYAAMFRLVLDKVPGARDVVLSAHCHNDLGMAVANSLAAVQAGARQCEVSVNGIGERAGNAALEEIVMAIKTRRAYLKLDTGIRTKELFKTSKLLAATIGYPIAPNKAIVGKNAFAHESGIHQDGILKHRATYEIMSAESIGRKAGELVLGRHSGKHGFSKKLAELGYNPAAEELDKVYQRFLEVADKKKEVHDDDVVALIEEVMNVDMPPSWKVVYVSFASGNTAIPTATVELEHAGKTVHEAATGDGPVDAIYNAVDRIIGISDVKLEEYQLTAVTPGQDALGEVTVAVSRKGQVFHGRAASTDVVLASCHAYVNAVNRMLGKGGNGKAAAGKRVVRKPAGNK